VSDPAKADSPDLRFRETVAGADAAAVRALAEATGFFSAAEVAVAGELVEERLVRGAASGYQFILAERGGQLVGYACFGPIALTRAGFDLYWIIVAPEEQRAGLGGRLLAMAETAIAALGGERVYVDTSSRAQYAPTRAFYRKAGYREAAVLEDFYAPGDGKIVFEKRLAPRRQP
jgi:ribosomal protein S18 acetylase RimI-like enzyme